MRVERAAVTSLTGTRPYLGSTKNDGAHRVVHLPAHVVAILNAHLVTYAADSPDALVFAEPTGALVARETRQRAFHRARLTIGRPDLRWHDLRHTGATLAAQAGASVRELQRRLGHSTVRAAIIYQHATDERDREVAALLTLLASASVRQGSQLAHDRAVW